MASVTLGRVFLHDAADLDVYLALDAEVTETGSGPQSVELDAAGGSRMSSGRGILIGLDVTLLQCTQAEREQLTAWASTRLLWRDPRGRLVYGAYDGKDYTVTEYPAVNLCDITLRFVGSAPWSEES